MDIQNFLGRNSFVSFVGVVEDRNDPLKLKRVRVRCFGYHTEDKTLIPTETLPWASVVNEIDLKEADWVWGFFLDSTDCQEPVVIGKFLGVPSTAQNLESGFFDPREDVSSFPKRVSDVTQNAPGSGSTVTDGEPTAYPEFLNEPDTHRLARNEKTDEVPQKTIREALRDTGKPIAGGGTFDEPENPYAASYPFNDVKETESGHLFEVDDTPGAERIHTSHRTGTFEEYFPDGSWIRKVIQNCYNFVYGNWYQYVRGEKVVTIEQGKKLRVNNEGASNDLVIEVGSGGNFNVTVEGGNVSFDVTGDTDFTVSGNTTIDTVGTTTITGAGDVSIDSSSSNVTVDAAATLTLTGATINVGDGSGPVNIKGSPINLN